MIIAVVKKKKYKLPQGRTQVKNGVVFVDGKAVDLPKGSVSIKLDYDGGDAKVFKKRKPKKSK